MNKIKKLKWNSFHLIRRNKSVFECEACNITGSKLSLQIIVPTSKGGSLKEDNSLLLCEDCTYLLKKGQKEID
ncbi:MULTISPECIES: hypothetical protein [Vibrio harveyi group]|uniref:hypothetical protein n=1 Tax=Vibrio harveyi group TaxID=717610 RepID=UPI0006A57194|nr:MULTISPECIES: hypothetical protein [Vibrio harveyi group]EJB8450972.1 hypothetical protein [Vibrio parahaemolyticus]KOF31342.1 hypothetical protein ACX09_09135 [Vibrio alginolyticus]MCR9439459.1 hypothetical protein [Vibrio alginolyticus]MCS0103781.1 hypothetical protein [Vibrio alginolyticus]